MLARVQLTPTAAAAGYKQRAAQRLPGEPLALVSAGCPYSIGATASQSERSRLSAVEETPVPDPNQADRFEVYVWISDGVGDDDKHRYTAEQGFADQPAIDTLAALLDGAKRTFSVLYPGVEAENFLVAVRRLGPHGYRPEHEAPKPTQGS